MQPDDTPRQPEQPEQPEQPQQPQQPQQPDQAEQPEQREQPEPPGARTGPPPGEQPTTTAPPAPRRLHRSRKDRVLGGVAGGLAEYFGIDPIITRLGFVALTFAGGAGVLLYIAAVLLVPNEGEAPPGDGAWPGRLATIAGVVVLVVAIAALLPGHGWWWFDGGGVMWALAVGGLGLAVWWLASGEGPSGSGRDVLRRIGLGLGLVGLCALLAIGAFWAAAAGGGTVVAAIVIAAGVAMVAAAFVGGARWLILPALAIALPAAFVAAAGIDTTGGIGEREYRPASVAQVRDRYELGIGRLVVDLRGADLSPGDHHVDLKMGAGETIVVVPPDVCVAATAKVGMGRVSLFGRDTGGVDVDWEELPAAPASTARVVVDADLGVGSLEFRHTVPPGGWDGDHRTWWNDGGTVDGTGNAACTESTA